MLIAVASTMMSIEFITPTPINPYIQTPGEDLELENLRKKKDHIIVTADKGVPLFAIDKTEHMTKCDALL